MTLKRTQPVHPSELVLRALSQRIDATKTNDRLATLMKLKLLIDFCSDRLFVALQRCRSL